MPALLYCKQGFLMALPGVRVVLLSVIWEVGLQVVEETQPHALPLSPQPNPHPNPNLLSATTLFLPRSSRTHSRYLGHSLLWLHMRRLMFFIKKLCVH